MNTLQKNILRSRIGLACLLGGFIAAVGAARTAVATTLIVNPRPGFNMTWTGTEAEFVDGPVPNNLALASNVRIQPGSQSRSHRTGC